MHEYHCPAITIKDVYSIYNKDIFKLTGGNKYIIL